MRISFVKGHGTRNDFVVVPDLDGRLAACLDEELVRRLCDRRSGIGADGVLRVARADPAAGAAWFMDYRNADGSVAQMCGNGIRVFARYLEQAGLVDPAEPLEVDTRDGRKSVTFCENGDVRVDMGTACVGGRVTVHVDGRAHEAVSVDVGNPHAVVLVDALSEAGALVEPPRYDEADFPDGANVEFAVRTDADRVAMRVFERGVGETQSCGTGACAVAAVVRARDLSGSLVPARDPSGDLVPQVATLTGGTAGGAMTSAPASYRVDVPGGTLTVDFDDRDHAFLAGPAVLVAEGTWLG